ncbi:MAG: hypothetical protein O2867_11210, partial [Bacteroidetes bacterium]|nr:hypothetical protein [Bacteroidota bacterium]
MKGLLVIIALIWFHTSGISQTVTLPIDFDPDSIASSDFSNFDGGEGTAISNPVPTAINPSNYVGRMVRNGGQQWAGAYLTATTNLDFSVNPIICMKVYTTASVGTRVSLKMENASLASSGDRHAFTTVSGEWETLCYDFTGQPTNFNRLVFLFDLYNVGNGTSTSTFYFDDIQQLSTQPPLLTPGSQIFCPNGSLTLTYPGSGTYNWYADSGGNTLLQAGSSTYTTPVLTSGTSYYVQDMSSVSFPTSPVGPSVKGGSAIGNSITTSTFFISNLDNGLFHSVDIVLHLPTGPPVGNACTYRVDLFNITQGTSRTNTRILNPASNFSQHFYDFSSSPLPLFINDQLELRITSVTGPPCYCTSTSQGDNGLFLPFPNSYDPQLTFTAHTSNGNSNSLMSGLNYVVSGDFVNPTLYQVNAIADCGSPLPVELLNFTVRDNNGDALLTWATASELNNDRFLVMRTLDGIEYETIGTVNGAGNSSSILQYSFRDRNPLLGLSYYQLKQIDYDGTESLSAPVSFMNRNGDEFVLSPNPTTRDVNILLGNLYEEVQVRISDITGRQLEHLMFQETENLNFELQGFPG